MSMSPTLGTLEPVRGMFSVMMEDPLRELPPPAAKLYSEAEMERNK